MFDIISNILKELALTIFGLFVASCFIIYVFSLFMTPEEIKQEFRPEIIIYQSNDRLI